MLSRVLWGVGGLIAGACAFSLMWSKSLSPISKMFLSLSYEIQGTADQIRTDPSTAGATYLIGRWDVLTVAVYTFLMVYWFSGATWMLQMALAANTDADDPAVTSRLAANFVFHVGTMFYVVYNMCKGPFLGFVWSAFPGYLPYGAKLIFLCQIAYALQGVVYNVFFRTADTRPVPMYKELGYAALISLVAYVSLLAPMGYIFLLTRTFLDFCNNLGFLIERFEPNSPVAKLCQNICKFGTVGLHVIFFILGILVCCWSNASSKSKYVAMVLISISLILEIATFVLLVTQPVDQGNQAGDRGARGKNTAANKGKKTATKGPTTRSTSSHR